MTNQQEKSRNQSPAVQMFYAEDGVTVPFWDHPNFTDRIAPPDDYQPITRVEQAIEYHNRGIISEDALVVLKVVGDALCANENQLRRYMKKYNVNFGTTHTSKILRKLMKYGLVERHVCRLSFIENEGEQEKRPAPFTLGIGGVKFLNHYYTDMPFVSPETWRESAVAVQRYVSMNEIRCLGAYTGKLRNWIWHPRIGGNAIYRKPLAVAVWNYPSDNNVQQKDIQMIFERAQSAQRFMEHLRTRLRIYRELYERDQCIWIDGLPKNTAQVVVLSVGTVQMAKRIHTQLKLTSFPFPIWFVIDEWMETNEQLANAFAQPLKEEGQLKRIHVPLLLPTQL
ncbi:hypothetical protein D7X33_19145 [Butyricicoccus sp. 1XD8-22]|nr:hypothetical protein D7X33_19145 [Butyricicoccus sp. 1XD8-22]